MPRQPISPYLIAAILAALLAGGAWLYFAVLRPAPEPPPMPPVPPPTVAPSPPPPPPEPEPALELPPLADSDPLIRSLVSGLGSTPALGRLLAADGLVRRFVAAVDNVSRGESPRSHLRLLAPASDFDVRRTEDGLEIDPGAYRRYDGVAAAVAALDADAAARLFRDLEPLLDEAYRELGYPDGDFEAALVRAIDRLLATPRLDDPPDLRPGVTSYRFDEPRLERLDAVQKHLLRMGPDNTGKIQSQARALKQALGAGG